MSRGKHLNKTQSPEFLNIAQENELLNTHRRHSRSVLEYSIPMTQASRTAKHCQSYIRDRGKYTLTKSSMVELETLLKTTKYPTHVRQSRSIPKCSMCPTAMISNAITNCNMS